MYYKVNQTDRPMHRIERFGKRIFEFDVDSGWTIYSITFDEGDIIIHITEHKGGDEDAV